MHSPTAKIDLRNGYDECPDHRGLNRAFKNLDQTSAKVYVAGRAPINLEADIRGNSQLELTLSDSDLAIYFESCLEEDEHLDSLLGGSLRAEVISTLVKYADGV